MILRPLLYPYFIVYSDTDDNCVGTYSIDLIAELSNSLLETSTFNITIESVCSYSLITSTSINTITIGYPGSILSISLDACLNCKSGVQFSDLPKYLWANKYILMTK